MGLLLILLENHRKSFCSNHVLKVWIIISFKNLHLEHVSKSKLSAETEKNKVWFDLILKKVSTKNNNENNLKFALAK